MTDFAIGAIRRPHGVRGAVKVFSFSGEADHFSALEEVELRRDGARRRYRVSSVEVHNGTPVLYLEGIENPEDARRLSGSEVWVSGEYAAPLGENEYYARDLVGLRVKVGTGPVGVVVAVIDGAQAPLLEVELGERTVLIPFMEQFLALPSWETGSIELVAPWILDLE